MKRILFIAISAAVITASCSKETLKKHTATYFVNGTKVECDENTVSASFNNGNYNELVVDMMAKDGSNHNVILVLDVTKMVGQEVAFDSTAQTFYSKDNTITRYKPVAGTWKITGRKETDNTDKYTEGTFNFVGVNQTNINDTVRITTGSFFVNKYN